MSHPTNLSIRKSSTRPPTEPSTTILTPGAPPPSNKPRPSDQRPNQFFTVAPDINPEALLAHTYETFCSASTLTLDLSDDLEGKQRNLALAIYGLMELGLLLIEKTLDSEQPVKV